MKPENLSALAQFVESKIPTLEPRYGKAVAELCAVVRAFDTAQSRLVPNDRNALSERLRREMLKPGERKIIIAQDARFGGILAMLDMPDLELRQGAPGKTPEDALDTLEETPHTVKP